MSDPVLYFLGNMVGTGVIVGLAGVLLWDKIKGMTDSIKELYGRTDRHETRLSVREEVCLMRHGKEG